MTGFECLVIACLLYIGAETLKGGSKTAYGYVVGKYDRVEYFFLTTTCVILALLGMWRLWVS